VDVDVDRIGWAGVGLGETYGYSHRFLLTPHLPNINIKKDKVPLVQALRLCTGRTGE